MSAKAVDVWNLYESFMQDLAELDSLDSAEHEAFLRVVNEEIQLRFEYESWLQDNE